MSSPDAISLYLDSLAALAMQELGLPGMALGVTNREGLLKTSAYGLTDIATQQPVTTSTLFEIGSLGKPFTVIPLMQLREERVLDLNAPVSRYLPWFQLQSDFPEITIHHLLNHTSGLPRGTDIAPHGLYESWALRDFRPVAPPVSISATRTSATRRSDSCLSISLARPCPKSSGNVSFSPWE